jgi:pyruvate dehydrogenase E2 component (dihydrolipoamide acetyltransferase)
MAKPIKIPDMGTTVDTLTLNEWLMEEGETVARGDALAEIQTDKAEVDLESYASGVLLKKLVADGAEVEVGQVVAYVGAPGENLPE